MAKSTKVAQVAQVVEIVAAPAAEVAAKRLPLVQARAANFAHTTLTADEIAVAAGVVKTAKGTNAHKLRVYGYDNGVGGGSVPKAAVIAVVPGTTAVPAGVTAQQWAALQAVAGQSVQAAYDGNTVSSRTVRRAYRAGAIRFVA